MTHCSVCAETSHNIIKANEKMFGLPGIFAYRECHRCGHVELIDKPADIVNFYPPNYYSFRRPARLKTFLKRRRTAHTFGRKNLLGMLMEKAIGVDPTFEWIKCANVAPQHKILDIGCGTGIFLRELRDCGYCSITGIDPYIEKNYRYGTVNVLKKSVFDLDEPFDFIMLNHSFEHMLEPLSVLKKIAGILNKNGTVLIRVPVVGYAWTKYRENWVGLDAPRHLFIPSKKSLAILAHAAGLQIEKVVYDSTDFQFWASEQYVQNI